MKRQKPVSSWPASCQPAILITHKQARPPAPQLQPTSSRQAALPQISTAQAEAHPLIQLFQEGGDVLCAHHHLVHVCSSREGVRSGQVWGGWKVEGGQRHGGWTGVLQVRACGDSRLQGGRRQPAIRTERKRRHTPQGLAAAGAHRSPCPPCCHTAGAPPAPEPPRSACGAVAGRQYKQYKQYRQSEAKAASRASSVLKTCCSWGKAAKQRQIGFATLQQLPAAPLTWRCRWWSLQGCRPQRAAPRPQASLPAGSRRPSGPAWAPC